MLRSIYVHTVHKKHSEKETDMASSRKPIGDRHPTFFKDGTLMRHVSLQLVSDETSRSPIGLR